MSKLGRPQSGWAQAIAAGARAVCNVIHFKYGIELQLIAISTMRSPPSTKEISEDGWLQFLEQVRSGVYVPLLVVHLKRTESKSFCAERELGARTSSKKHYAPIAKPDVS
jgi:hypothetical protein